MPALAPSPAGGWPLYHLRPMQAERLAFLQRCMLEHGDVVRLRFPGGRLAHLVSSPEGVKHVLQDNARRYDKETASFTRMRAMLGLGLLTSDGELWLRQRRLIQPAFHRERLASFASVMVSDAEALAQRWDTLAGTGQQVDVAHEMMRLTLRTVGTTLFSRDISGEADRVGGALTFALEHTARRITAAVATPDWLPTPANLRFRRARATFDELVFGLIAERRASDEDRGDLLSMLLAARDEESGAPMSDTQLRDELTTLVIAGHETTANALAWTFALLDRHPEISQRLGESLGDRAPMLDDLPRLELLRCVVDESLRLYPPGWLLGRRSLGEDEIGGCVIPANTYVFLSPWTVHHNPRVWDDPERFDPDRFSRDRAAAIPRYAYFPFGGGPRLCIGQGFALMQAQLVLAVLARRFRLRLAPGTRAEVDPQITLRPLGGLWMTIERRS